MNHKLTILLKKYPLFLFLLPVFFVLHGFTENYDFVPAYQAVLLTGLYIGSSLIFLILFRLVYKNWLKAAALSFLIMAYHFFFGSIQDGIRNVFPGTWVSSYIFILTLSIGLLVLVMICLKKRKRSIHQLALYLNFLFLLLISMDAIWLAGKVTGRKKEPMTLSKEFTSCDTCSTPDFYFIIMDEYAGNSELSDILHYDNTPFLHQLSALGFHVIPNSSSNYNYTPYSIASALNMDYLDPAQSNQQPLLTFTYNKIRDNNLLKFLQYHQYQFYNYTFFDFKGQPSFTQETFLPAKTRLITGQTFLSRLNKELRFNLVTRFNSQRELRKLVYANRNNNEKLYQLTHTTASEKAKGPRFVLTHLMMPHYPYYFDKDGKEFPFETLQEGKQDNQLNYVEYLRYSNNKLLILLNQILKHAASPPVIVLMGDHGFRHFNKPVDPTYYFSNLAAIYIPGKNYSAFTDSMTNVNVVRATLNTVFRQQLPYLKDSTIIMENP